MKQELRAVALGGGTGLYATLSALRRITPRVTAVVTVADDGGSSGRLRQELDLLPPGDLRQALSALSAADNGPLWTEVLQHRFGGSGELAGHAVGNLLLAGLFEVLGDPVRALDELCSLMGISGRVLPMSPYPLRIEAEVRDDRGVHSVRGQAAVARTLGCIQRITLVPNGKQSSSLPDDSPRTPVGCREAITEILNADVVFLGPGSWFTSVLPHLLVPQLREALMTTSAKKVVILNLTAQPGETTGFSPEQHLDVLREYAPGLRINSVIADRASVPAPERLDRAAAALSARTYLADIADSASAGRHDYGALADCIRDAVETRISQLADNSEEEK